jgi:hypothetical protein
MRPYARIDSLRRHVLRIHLNQASPPEYGLRGLPGPHPDMPGEDGRSPVRSLPVMGWSSEGPMHYKNNQIENRRGFEGGYDQKLYEVAR